MHKNNVTVEFEIDTQFGPANAVSLIQSITCGYNTPAIKSVKLLKISSTYTPQSPHEENYQVLNGDFPKILK